MTPKTALNDYSKLLARRKQLEETFASEVAKIDAAVGKISDYLDGKSVDSVPVEVAEANPMLAFNLTPRTDESLVKTYRTINDTLIPQLSKPVEAKVKVWKSQLETLEGIAAQVLTERKSTSFSIPSLGGAELRTSTNFKVTNKAAYVNWAIESGAESEITVSAPKNSKFLAQVLADEGAYPPGIEAETKTVAVFVKG